MIAKGERKQGKNVCGRGWQLIMVARQSGALPANIQDVREKQLEEGGDRMADGGDGGHEVVSLEVVCAGNP